MLKYKRVYTDIDIQRRRERYKFKQKILITLLIAVPLLTIFLLSSANISALASEVNNVSSDFDIKYLVFGTNTEVERSSRRPKLIHIKRGEYVYTIFTLETDIYKILQGSFINLNSKDRVIINTEYIKNGSLVRIVQTESIIEQIEIEIPFNSETIKTDKYAKGEQNILQQGVLGVKTQQLLSYYEDGILVDRVILAERVVKEPVKQIVEIGTAFYSLAGIEPRGYNCPYWYQVVDAGPYTEEEKRWLKFVMHCESGCNAESNKNFYKGLFQWSPTTWRKQFSENIFDGHAQIKNTVSKYRAGESTRANQWPACNKKYNEQSSQ